MALIEPVDDLSSENQPVFNAFNTFLQKLKDEEWLSHTSKEEVKSCLHSAKNVERMLETLDANNSLESFLSLVPNLYGFNTEQLQSISDVVLAMVLTAPGVPLPCVHTCIDEFFELCGSNRFERVLSSVLFCSEIYRVILDYLASSECDSECSDLKLRSQLFLHLWKHETDSEKLKQIFNNWLKADDSGQNIAVALMVIKSEDPNNIVSSTLVFILKEVLQERGNLALTFWRIFIELAEIRKALEKSSDLLASILEFLKTSAQWMEATATFSWTSREDGPCKAFGFDEVVKIVQCLQESEELVSQKTRQFLLTCKNSVGCTLWDDIEMRLKDF